MVALGELKEVPVREVFKDETVFTRWLAQDSNMAIFCEKVGLQDFTMVERESRVGSFRADIFAVEAGTDRKIVIENQYGDTNHDHFGKLLTYAAGKEAQVAIWIVEHAREEHRRAIEMLNNCMGERLFFFLCELRLYCIGDSAPAPKFEVVERPNGWGKEARKSESVREMNQPCFDYWMAFSEYAFKNVQFANEFIRRNPSKDQSMHFSVGFSDCRINVVQVRKKKKLYIKLYICNNKKLFRALFQQKNVIESSAGVSFEWDEMPGHKGSCIYFVEEDVDFSNKEKWVRQFDGLIDDMLKIKKTFEKFL